MTYRTCDVLNLGRIETTPLLARIRTGMRIEPPAYVKVWSWQGHQGVRPIFAIQCDAQHESEVQRNLVSMSVMYPILLRW